MHSTQTLCYSVQHVAYDHVAIEGKKVGNAAFIHSQIVWTW